MGYKIVDTAVTMMVGPCIDDSDFKTLEEAIAYDAAGMDVSLIVEKTDGTTAVTSITLTTGGVNDWTHIDGGYYEVELTDTQNIEEGVGYIRGACTGVLPFESAHYDVVPANVYDSFVKGTDKLEVDTTLIDGATATTVINDEVVDVMKTDTTAEMGVGAPPATPTFEEMLAYVYFRLRNKCTTTATLDSMWANDGTTELIRATIGDDGTTFTKEEYVSGV